MRSVEAEEAAAAGAAGAATGAAGAGAAGLAAAGAGAGAAFAGAGAGAVAVAEPAPSITATMVWMGTVWPSAILISLRTPAEGEGISASTLSVEISKRGSSRSTLSPGFLSHLVMVPSKMLSPIWGMTTSTAMGLLSLPRGTSALRGTSDRYQRGSQPSQFTRKPAVTEREVRRWSRGDFAVDRCEFLAEHCLAQGFAVKAKLMVWVSPGAMVMSWFCVP